MTDERWLRLLQLLYQGLNLITQGIKKEIDELKAEKAEKQQISSL